MVKHDEALAGADLPTEQVWQEAHDVRETCLPTEL